MVLHEECCEQARVDASERTIRHRMLRFPHLDQNEEMQNARYMGWCERATHVAICPPVCSYRTYIQCLPIGSSVDSMTERYEI